MPAFARLPGLCWMSGFLYLCAKNLDMVVRLVLRCHQGRFTRSMCTHGNTPSLKYIYTAPTEPRIKVILSKVNADCRSLPPCSTLCQTPSPDAPRYSHYTSWTSTGLYHFPEVVAYKVLEMSIGELTGVAETGPPDCGISLSAHIKKTCQESIASLGPDNTEDGL